jgi:hypothetical protein
LRTGEFSAAGVRSKRPQASDKKLMDRVNRLLVLIKRIRRAEARKGVEGLMLEDGGVDRVWA